MDNKKVDQSKSPIQKKDNKKKLPFEWYDWVCIFFLAITVFFFMMHRNYDVSKEIANDVWGQIGDFVGGILGTFIAYVGIRLLVKTLNAQINANDTASESFEENKKVFVLQQFDGNFNTLLKLYEETIDAYCICPEKKGRNALHEYAEGLRSEVELNKETYEERIAAAAEAFNQKFYIPHREVASVHFRTLYRLFQLIRESKITEDKKVLYAKMLRGRMSEDELLLLRYNCHCTYGQKMQTNINRFNLLKHLPVLSLLEFETWRMKFNKDGFLNCVDTEFIALKKHIKDLLINEQINESRWVLSDKYSIVLSTDDSKKELNLDLTKETRKPAIKTIDNVFDCCTTEELRVLLQDFLYETFVGSNFGVFNAFDNLIIKNHHVVTDDGLHIVKMNVRNSNDFVLSMNVRQYDDPKS